MHADRLMKCAGGAFALSLCCAVPALAQQPAPRAPSNWYAGAGYGQTRYDTSLFGNLDQIVSSRGPGTLTGGGTRDTGYRGFVGFHFNENWAVEGGYMNAGRLGLSSTVVSPAAGTASGTFKVSDAWTADVVGTYPIQHQGFSIFGRLGFAYAKAEFSLNGNAGAAPLSFTGSTERFVPHVGFGLRYDFTQRVGVRGEWSRLSQVGNSDESGQSNVDFLGVDFLFRF